jgi:hypothetical protein
MSARVLLKLLQAAKEVLSSDKAPPPEAFRKLHQRMLERKNPFKLQVQEYEIFTPGGN